MLEMHFNYQSWQIYIITISIHISINIEKNDCKYINCIFNTTHLHIIFNSLE
jgi:hypothetical protein